MNQSEERVNEKNDRLKSQYLRHWICLQLLTKNLAEERINDNSQSEDFSQLQERSGNFIKIKVAFDWQKGLLYYWDYFK